VQKILLILLSSVMTIVVLAQIAGRFIFKYSLPWSEELSVILFIVIIFWGANIAIKTDSEIAIEVLKFQNPKKALIHWAVKDIFSLICIALLIISAVIAISESTVRPRAVASMQWFKYTYIYMLMFIGLIFILFDKLVRFMHHIYDLFLIGKGET